MAPSYTADCLSDRLQAIYSICQGAQVTQLGDLQQQLLPPGPKSAPKLQQVMSKRGSQVMDACTTVS